MDVSIRLAAVLAVCLLCLATCAQGCQNGIGRRKRNADPTAPEVNNRLATFFGSCSSLRKAASGILPSLPSAVDYTIRDTNWYKNVDDDVCAGDRDVAECWIYALDFLLDFKSPLFEAAAQCICDWAGTCFKIPKAVYTASTTSSQRYNAGQTGCGSSLHPKKPDLTSDQKKFSKCLDANAKRFISRYPSLRRFDAKSVTILLRDHYTFCRTIPDFPYEQRNLFGLLYIDRICPRNGREATWRKDVSEVFRIATREDGPIARGVGDCQSKPFPPDFGPWGPWSPCNPTCGESWRVRKRQCIAYHCNGITNEREPCRSKPCPRDPCERRPCRNGGKCVIDPLVIPLGFRCKCPIGYTGFYCKSANSNPPCEDSHRLCAMSQNYFCTYTNGGQCRRTCGLC